MKYFTPELFVRTNSPNEDEAEAASAEWERRLQRARKHFNRIKPQLPESVRKFCEECCLHDADVFGPARLSVQTLPWGFQDVVIVVQNSNTLFPEHRSTLTFLQYAVTAEPTVETPVRSQVFRPGQPVWLYDEVDILEPSRFSHSILLSDGRVVRLQFREFRYHFAPLILAAGVATGPSLPPAAAV